MDVLRGEPDALDCICTGCERGLAVDIIDNVDVDELEESDILSRRVV